MDVAVWARGSAFSFEVGGHVSMCVCVCTENNVYFEHEETMSVCLSVCMSVCMCVGIGMKRYNTFRTRQPRRAPTQTNTHPSIHPPLPNPSPARHHLPLQGPPPVAHRPRLLRPPRLPLHHRAREPRHRRGGRCGLSGGCVVGLVARGETR